MSDKHNTQTDCVHPGESWSKHLCVEESDWYTNPELKGKWTYIQQVANTTTAGWPCGISSAGYLSRN